MAIDFWWRGTPSRPDTALRFVCRCDADGVLTATLGGTTYTGDTDGYG